MKSLAVVTAIVLILPSTTAIIWTSRSMEGQISRRVETLLQTVLDTSQGGLHTWQEQTIINASIVAASDEVRTQVETQLRAPRTKADLSRTDALARPRRILRPYVEQHQYVDFAVVAPDGIQIASSSDDLLGDNSLTTLNSGSLHQIFAGNTALGAPFALT